MRACHTRTVRAIFHRPVLGTIRWSEIESLFLALGAELEEHAGSRVAFVWKGQVHVFHRPYPSPDTGKGAVVSIKRILEANGVKP